MNEVINIRISSLYHECIDLNLKWTEVATSVRYIYFRNIEIFTILQNSTLYPRREISK